MSCGEHIVVMSNTPTLQASCGCSVDKQLYKIGVLEVKNPKPQNVVDRVINPLPSGPNVGKKPDAPVISNASKPSILKATNAI